MSIRDHLALGVSNCRPVATVARVVSEASEHGLGRVFMAEDIGCRDAFQLAAVAGQGQEVTISVTNPYLRSPRALAECVVTASEMTGKPVRLGLGASSKGIISGQIGLEYGGSVGVMRRTVGSVRRELLFMQPDSRFRIMVAAMGPNMLELAGELADAVILNIGTTPEHVAWARERILVGARGAGRDSNQIEIAVWVPVFAGAEPRQERVGRARRWAAPMLSIPRQGELLLERAGLPKEFLPELRSVCGAYPHTGDLAAGAACVPDEVVEKLAIIGTPAEALGRLRAFVDVGVHTLVMAPGGLRAVLSGEKEGEGG